MRSQRCTIGSIELKEALPLLHNNKMLKIENQMKFLDWGSLELIKHDPNLKKSSFFDNIIGPRTQNGL